MVDTTLRTLDSWFNDPGQGGDRPQLLSKLAVLELCGWIEGEFDRLAIVAEAGKLGDSDWVKKNLISKTFGFKYVEHWRPMLVGLVGEIFARRIEEKMERAYPGDLARLKSLLGTLWGKRCDFAHADMAANIAAQKSFDAPSWALNQHGVLKELLSHYEQVMVEVLVAV